MEKGCLVELVVSRKASKPLCVAWGNAVQPLRDEGVGRAGLVAVKVSVKVPVGGRRGRAG
jgi:hypothetical protein